MSPSKVVRPTPPITLMVSCFHGSSALHRRRRHDSLEHPNAVRFAACQASGLLCQSSCFAKGVFALDDVAMWPIPAAREEVERGLAASGLGRVLASPRWKHPDAARALVDLLMALQDAALACGDGLAAIDVNPVILGAHGAMAVDALVVPR